MNIMILENTKLHIDLMLYANDGGNKGQGFRRIKPGSKLFGNDFNTLRKLGTGNFQLVVKEEDSSLLEGR